MFKIENTETPGNRVTLDERVWLARDGYLVKDGDPRAAVLYCAPGHSVPREEFERLSAIAVPNMSDREFGRPEVATQPKSKPKPKDKARDKPANKGKGE